MAFDGIITKQIVKELNTCLIDGKINKIFEPNKNEILLGIYANHKNYNLLINIDSGNLRMHLTNTQKPNPINAFNFCMLLRKHLIGMKIKSISSYDLERIITIELEGYNELNDFITKKLVVELMGKHGNIILLNNNNIIIDSLRHLDTFSNSNRDILPAHEYLSPLSDKVSFINIHTFEEFYNIVSSKQYLNYIDSISDTFIGISKTFLHYLYKQLKLYNENISKNDLELIYNNMKSIITASNLGCIPYDVSNKSDYIPTIVKEDISLNVNFFIDDFYSKKEENENFKNYRNSILKVILAELKKYTKRLNNINLKIEECNNMDTYKLYGELITANLYRIDNTPTTHVELENYYDNNNLISIPLDKTISPVYNAKKYFKKYNKLKNALEIVSKQKKDTANEINYIESIIYELDNAKTISDIDSIYEEISENTIFKASLNMNKTSKKTKNKIKQTEFSPITLTIDDYTVYVGKNNKQNDFLTLKFAHKNDLWFHTKSVHGSHVILKTNNDEIPQNIINKCASLAAFYSKASTSSNVSVDYTLVRYVKKPSNSRPGMVIYTNYKTVNVNPNNFFDNCK